MPRSLYSRDRRQLIATNIEGEVEGQAIADQLNVSPQLVSYYKRKLKTFGTIDPPRQGPNEPRPRLHAAAQDALKDHVAANSTSYLDEIQAWLEEEWDLHLSLQTIGRFLKSINHTHKKTDKTNEVRDDYLRAAWLAKLSQLYTTSQLVVVDESASNERDKDRRWGWSEKGVVCRSE